MKRAQLEHIIRAACTIADDDELVIIGSQSILAQFPDAPEELVVSLEADVYPRHHPERAELIEGSIGELSMFHRTFGYYADGVDVHTATLPAGWEDRLVPIRGPGTAGNTGWALEVHDLLISKYVANREKDRNYTRAALRYGLVDVETLRARLAATPVADDRRTRIAACIAADAAG
ncbi:MAG TPA: DUF6036 family nucleotidyltransferase [Kofleriaceae bacterium]|nr:DUF6036 family nucleotidyltransferase [Kofleriaceae bacterium]